MEEWKSWEELGGFTKFMFNFIIKMFAMGVVKKIIKNFSVQDFVEKMGKVLHNHSKRPLDICKAQAFYCWDRNVREYEEFCRKGKT